MMRNILLLLVFVLASACHSTRPPAQTGMPPDPGLTCLDSLAHRPEYSAIADKVALGKVSGQTFEMLSNASTPDVREKQAISEWVSARQECFRQSTEWSRQVNMPLTLLAINENGWSGFLILTADLYNGKLRYGEYAQARAKGDAQGRKEWAAAIQHLQEQQVAADEQRRTRAMLNQRRTTSCSVVGDQMRCTTR